MVFHYTIRGGRCKNAHSHITLTSEDITCYVGRDKHENEYLIQYGWPGDIWFHVEGLSSAHVYFRLDCRSHADLLGKLPIDDLPDPSVEDMCQIVKHNSIKGGKMASCKIVYTPHSNLKKTFQMESGAVTYHDPKLQRFRRCDKDRQRVKELERTKSKDLAVDYYEEMKANERRIIEWKRTLRKNGDSIDIYDPVLDDLRGAKTKAQRQGDEASGLDSGLAALEGLGLGGGGGGREEPTAADLPKPSEHTALEDKSHLPKWQQEANARLDNPNETTRFLLARGYTFEEIRELGSKDDSAPASIALSKLWKAENRTTTTVQEDNEELWSQIYESRNEEKEVLEAIYGEDDLARLGWKRDGDEGDDDQEENDDSECDPTQPFPFDCVLPVPGYEPPPRYECPPPLLLEIYVDHGVSFYPYPNPTGGGAVDPPVLALVGGGLPTKYLRTITDALREKIYETECEPGEPQLFDLLQLAGELATDVLQTEEADLAEEATRQRAAKAKKDREEAARRIKEKGDMPSNEKPTNFQSEAERRAYAQSVLSKGLAVQTNDTPKGSKAKDKKYYGDAGADNLKLISDVFG